MKPSPARRACFLQPGKPQSPVVLLAELLEAGRGRVLSNIMSQDMVTDITSIQMYLKELVCGYSPKYFTEVYRTSHFGHPFGRKAGTKLDKMSTKKPTQQGSSSKTTLQERDHSSPKKNSKAGILQGCNKSSSELQRSPGIFLKRTYLPWKF